MVVIGLYEFESQELATKAKERESLEVTFWDQGKAPQAFHSVICFQGAVSMYLLVMEADDWNSFLCLQPLGHF